MGVQTLDHNKEVCSKGVHENGDLELLTVKKKLDLNESAKEEDVENKEVGEENNVGGKNEVKENDDAQFKSSGEEKGVETIVVEDNGGEVPLEKEGSQWELAIGTPTNIVAHATVDLVAGVLHGKPLGKDNVRVSITRVIQGAAQIPFPVDDDVMTVEQAVGTFIAWPRKLVTGS